MAENIIQHGLEVRADHHAHATLGEGALMAAETTTATREYLTALEKTYIPFPRDEAGNPTRAFFAGCVDDREPTEESGKALVAQMSAKKSVEIAHPIHEGYVRVPGGLAGEAKLLAATVAIQTGPEALEAYDGDFEAFMADVNAHIQRATGIESALHKKCAAAKVGAVSEIATTDTAVLAEGTEVFHKYFDGLVNATFDQIIEGERQMASHFFGKQEEWANAEVSPEAYADDPSKDIPVMELEGNHANPEETVMVINLDPHAISNPDTAIKEWGQAYNIDATVVAEALMRAYPRLNLDPRVMLPVLFQTAVAVRGALTGGQPKQLAMVVRGDVTQAFAHLDTISAQLKR